MDPVIIFYNPQYSWNLVAHYNYPFLYRARRLSNRVSAGNSRDRVTEKIQVAVGSRRDQVLKKPQCSAERNRNRVIKELQQTKKKKSEWKKHLEEKQKGIFFSTICFGSELLPGLWLIFITTL